MFWNCLAVGVGGFLGSVCRYLVSLIPLGKGAPSPSTPWPSTWRGRWPSA